MVLILLTLLALSAAQVTGLQERMSGIYRADNLAFQSAEQRIRRTERELLVNPIACEEPPRPSLPSAWLDGTAATSAVTIENFSKGAPGVQPLIQASAEFAASGGCEGLFRVSAFAFDDEAAQTSRAINQTSYIP